MSVRKKAATHLGRDDIVCHVPDPGLHVRGVGEGEAFDFGGDGADDRVVLLVGLPHHADVPATAQKMLLLLLLLLGDRSPTWRPYLPHHIQQDEDLDEPEHAAHPHVGDDQRFGCFVIKHRVETVLEEVCGLAHLCTNTRTHTPVMICAPMCSSCFSNAHIQMKWNGHILQYVSAHSRDMNDDNFYLFKYDQDPTNTAFTQPCAPLAA